MSMKDEMIDPIDAQVGGDGDIQGIAQTISAQDIRATLISERPVAERVAALEGMKHELEARDNVDRGGDMALLIADIDHALGVLRSDQPMADPDAADIKTY